MSKNTVCIVAALLLSRVATGGEARIWTDSSGRFSVSAEVVEVQGGEVILRKTDGYSQISLPVSRLSIKDLDWLKENVQPRTLVLPPVQIDIKTLITNEAQRIDLRAALGGLDEFSVVEIAINGEPASPLRGESIHKSGDSVEFELKGSPGATIELQRGGGKQAKTLLIRPRMVLQPDGARVTFSLKSLSETKAVLTEHIATTIRDVRAAEAVLARMPAEIAESQRGLRLARTDRDKVRWTTQIVKQQSVLKAAQTRMRPLQKRLASLPAHEQHAAAALKWLTEARDGVVLTFRLETTVANQWCIPVARTWTAHDQTTLGVLADVAAECWQLQHRCRDEERIGERELKAVVEQLESKLASRQVTIPFKIADIAAHPHGKDTLSVRPVERLAGVAYPSTIARSLAKDGVEPKLGEVLTITGLPSLTHRRPAANPRPFGPSGDQMNTALRTSTPRAEPAILTLCFDVPNVSEDVLQLWLHVASSVTQETTKYPTEEPLRGGTLHSGASR